MLRPYKQKSYRGRKFVNQIRNLIGWLLGLAVLIAVGYGIYRIMAPAVSETGQAINTDWTSD